MKNILISLINILVYSLYFSNIIPNVILLLYIGIGIITAMYLVFFNIQLKKEAKHYSIFTWICIWGIVFLLILLRDIEMLQDITLAGCILSLFVLFYVVITSCYVIMKDSKYWFGHLFSCIAVHWVLFHDTRYLPHKTPWIHILPIVCFVIIRIVEKIEINNSILFIDLFLLLILFVLEILHIQKEIQNTPFYLINVLLYGCILFMNYPFKTLFMILVTPFAALPVTLYVLWIIMKFPNGYERSWHILNNAWEDSTGVTLNESHISEEHQYEFGLNTL